MSDTQISVPPNVQGLMRAGTLGRFGVTWCGYLLLSAAAGRDCMTYRELAAGAGLSFGTVPVLVNTMCQEELLTRTAESWRQGGRVLVTMTEQGRQHMLRRSTIAWSLSPNRCSTRSSTCSAPATRRMPTPTGTRVRRFTGGGTGPRRPPAPPARPGRWHTRPGRSWPGRDSRGWRRGRPAPGCRWPG
jgi:hypothetical protein